MAETAAEWALVEQILFDSPLVRGASRRRVPAIQRRHRDLVEAAKAILGATFRENLRLPELSAALGVTPGRLCRVFRGVAGTTLHHYRDQLRLRTALEALAEPQADLTELALELGYSSHSHFSHRFRRAFATRPSAFRTEAANTC